jgi:phage terminase large subunit-like protein
MQPYHTAHNVELPEGAPWVEEYILQHAQFPNAKVNDDVDAQSQGLAGLEKGLSGMDLWERMEDDGAGYGGYE